MTRPSRRTAPSGRPLERRASGARAPGRRCGPYASRSRATAVAARRPRGPRACARRLRRPSTVSTSSRPRPARLAGGPSMPVGIGDARGRASGSRRTGRAPRRRGGHAPRCRCPSPAARSAARSASVALEPGQDHEVGIARQRRARRHQLEDDVGLGRERVEIVEIGDAAAGAARRSGSVARRAGRVRRLRGCRARATSSAGRRARGLEPGHDAETASPVRARDLGARRLEQRGIAAELVDEIAARGAPLARPRARHACRPGSRSRRRARCRRPARPARPPRRRSPCWRCRPRAG